MREDDGSPSKRRFVRDSILAHWAAGSTCRKEFGSGLVLMESSHKAKKSG